MKWVVTIFCLLINRLLCGQFAVVNDKDGFVNVRDSAKITAKVVDKLKNGHFIFLFESEGNWTNIDYSGIKETVKNGYVYKDRYTLITDFPSGIIKTQTANSIVLTKDSILVTINQKKFDKKKHRFKYVAENQVLVELIDNKPYYGRDGDMPAREYSSIQVLVGNKKIDFPKEALVSLYEPSLSTTTVYYDIQNNILYISAQNGDGAGAYNVIWKIEKGAYKERFVCYGF